MLVREIRIIFDRCEFELSKTQNKNHAAFVCPATFKKVVVYKECFAPFSVEISPKLRRNTLMPMTS